MKKIILAMILCFAVVAMGSISALAGDTDVTTLMSNGVQTVQTDIMSVIAVVLPALLAITAAIIGIKFGLRFIKKLGSAG